MGSSRQHVEGDKNALLESLLSTAEPGSVVHEAQKSAITVRCTEDIEHAIGQLRSSVDANSAAASKLGGRVLWLNAVLAAATVVMAIATVLLVRK